LLAALEPPNSADAEEQGESPSPHPSSPA
jgi:hypothetical protein